MKYQKTKQRVMSKMTIYPTGYACMVMVIIMLFVSFLAPGCVTGKAGQEVTKVADEAPDSSMRVESTKEGTSGGLTAKAEEEKEAGAREKTQPPAMIQTPTKKQPLGLKPLLAVMSRKAGHPKKGGHTDPSVHVELAFDNADVYEVLDVTLYELFKVNYMVDPSIKAKVTFHLSGDFTKTQFINILNNVLQLNNLAIVRGPGGVYKVVRRTSSAGVSGAPLAAEEESDQAGDITRLIRLRYIAAATATKNIKPFLSRDAVVVQDTVTNSLIITDTADNLAKAASILGMMDVSQFTDVSWRVFPIEEVDAAEIAKDLSRILKTGGLYNRPGMDSASFEIIPIKTMNALLVVTRWPSMLKLIEDWITAMDHADDSGTSVFVYFVENGTAVELTDILKQLYGGSASGSSKKVTIVKPTTTEAGKRPSGELSSAVQIIPDETNNAIVFKATGRDYKIIKEVLKKLDIVPRQVLINVVIAEIKLNGSLEYGVEWFLQGHRNDYTVQGALDEGVSKAIDTALGTGPAGLSVAVFDSMDFMRGLVKALGTEGRVSILSSPNILAVDNKEAVIEVGEQVPLPTGETTTDTGTVTSIQYRDTGVILAVTPHINSSGLVKMELSQEVSEIGTEFAISGDLTANSILSRKAQTSLVIEDGQTIVLAGLMRSRQGTYGWGIPFLRDIPILGYLFGGSSKEINKDELIFLITPTVINTRKEADAITREFSQRVDHVKKLIKKKEF